MAAPLRQVLAPGYIAAFAPRSARSGMLMISISEYKPSYLLFRTKESGKILMYMMVGLMEGLGQGVAVIMGIATLVLHIGRLSVPSTLFPIKRVFSRMRTDVVFRSILVNCAN